jgi:hypothetical protein
MTGGISAPGSSTGSGRSKKPGNIVVIKIKQILYTVCVTREGLGPITKVNCPIQLLMRFQ